MKKAISSTISTNDLIKLAKETMTANDFRAVEYLMRAHLLSQRVPRDQSNPGTPNWGRQDLIEMLMLKNGGQSPDDFVRNRDASVARKAAAEAAYTPPPTQTPAAKRRAAIIMTACAQCGCDTQVAEDRLDEAERNNWPVFCSVQCQNKKKAEVNMLGVESQKFLKQVGKQYYDCGYNGQILLGYLQKFKKPVTAATLLEAFAALRPQLLPPLTADQIFAMTDKEFDQRARQEDSYTTNFMGGVDLTTLTKTAETTIHSSNKVRFRDLPRMGVAR